MTQITVTRLALSEILVRNLDSQRSACAEQLETAVLRQWQREVELNLLFHLRDTVPGLDDGKREVQLNIAKSIRKSHVMCQKTSAKSAAKSRVTCAYYISVERTFISVERLIISVEPRQPQTLENWVYNLQTRF